MIPEDILWSREVEKKDKKRARDMRAVRGRRATVCYSKRETARRLVLNLWRGKRLGTLYKGLYGEAPSERAPIFGFLVFEKVGKIVLSVCKKTQKG